jgi:hypothetical protein
MCPNFCENLIFEDPIPVIIYHVKLLIISKKKKKLKLVENNKFNPLIFILYIPDYYAGPLTFKLGDYNGSLPTLHDNPWAWTQVCI